MLVWVTFPVAFSRAPSLEDLSFLSPPPTQYKEADQRTKQAPSDFRAQREERGHIETQRLDLHSSHVEKITFMKYHAPAFSETPLCYSLHYWKKVLLHV